MWVIASISSASVLPFSLARPRWYTSWSVAPRVASTDTVTRLRCFGDSSVRGHTWPNSTSSVKCTKSGANSPNAFCAPDGSFSRVMRDSFLCGLAGWLLRQVRRDESQGGGDGLFGEHRLQVAVAVTAILGPV